jgi:hypothetical protein
MSEKAIKDRNHKLKNDNTKMNTFARYCKQKKKGKQEQKPPQGQLQRSE